MKSACRSGNRDVDAHRLVPAVGDRRQPRIERRRAGRRSAAAADSAKYWYSPRPKPCRAIDHAAAKAARPADRAPRARGTRPASAAARSSRSPARRARRRRRPSRPPRCASPTASAAASTSSASRAFMRPPRAPAARACARRPSDSPTAHRRCARRDGRGSRPPARSRRRPAPPRATAFGAPMRAAISA